MSEEYIDIERKFGSYEVSLVFEDRHTEDISSHCFIVLENQDGEGGAFSGSLEFVKSFGYIENDWGHQHNMRDALVDKIENWALKNGY